MYVCVQGVCVQYVHMNVQVVCVCTVCGEECSGCVSVCAQGVCVLRVCLCVCVRRVSV